MMNSNKVLVKLYVPTIEKKFDVWIPLNKRVCNVIMLCVKAVNEFSRGYYKPDKLPIIYDRETAEPYDVNLIVRDTTIRNGTELIMM
jgi:hypothetical protein